MYGIFFKEIQRIKVFERAAFIDPYGMALEWSSVEILKGFSRN